MERCGFHAVSIQSLAEGADVSVELIYQYFGSKEDVLQAVIVDIFGAYLEGVPEAISQAGDDPVERLAAGFDAYCRLANKHQRATALTYREANTLTPAGRPASPRSSDSNSPPFSRCTSWALKNWRLTPTFTLEEYVENQLAMVLRSLLPPESWPDCPSTIKKYRPRRQPRRR